VDDEQSRRRARREFIRTHHPDRGGDPGAFADGLAAYDRLPRRAPAAAPALSAPLSGPPSPERPRPPKSRLRDAEPVGARIGLIKA